MWRWRVDDRNGVGWNGMVNGYVQEQRYTASKEAAEWRKELLQKKGAKTEREARGEA